MIKVKQNNKSKIPEGTLTASHAIILGNRECSTQENIKGCAEAFSKTKQVKYGNKTSGGG